MTKVPTSADRLEHYVSKEPFDPYSVEVLTPEQERYYLATQWQLIWWKLKRHKLAVVSETVSCSKIYNIVSLGLVNSGGCSHL